MAYITMGKYDCIPPVTGTIDDLCIYKMHGQYFFRSRSSLTGERVKTDPAFQKTMHFAGLMARASRIGSVVYAALPGDCKQYPLYRRITGEALTWLKYEWTEADVLQWLQQRYTTQYATAFCAQYQEQKALEKESETDEEIYARFLARNNRRLLRRIRQGDDKWLFEIEDKHDEDKDET